jgi:2-oxoglutarate ferredoxin oxidoreductase subunit delta
MEQVKKERRGPRGNIEIRVDECKGCSYCVDVCPQKVLEISPAINRMGYHPSSYKGEGCTGCGICFYACPEPGAIAVYKLASTASAAE